MTKVIKKQALGRGLSALLKDPENDIQSVEDKNNGEVAACRIYLTDKNKKEHTLGYMKEADEDFIKQLTLGFQPYFETLLSRIYYYLEDEFDSDPQLCSVDFEIKYEARLKKIHEFMKSRFIHLEQ